MEDPAPALPLHAVLQKSAYFEWIFSFVACTGPLSAIALSFG